MAALHSDKLSFQAVRLYLCAVRHLQVTIGLPDPSFSSFPCLEYVLRGLRRSSLSHSRPLRLPVTPDVLHAIFSVWSRAPPSFDRTMLWASFCLGFFGFFRSGELTCPSLEAFWPDMLSPADITVDSHVDPSYISVFLKRSKTDPFGAGLSVHVGRTGDQLCPVAAILAYLAIRPPSPGPLFVFQDGSSLSQQHLVDALRQALSSAGIDASRFNGHSFRVGAVTTAAQAGLSEPLIKTLGRWRSSSYSLYIRTPRQQLTSVSSVLASVQAVGDATAH